MRKFGMSTTAFLDLMGVAVSSNGVGIRGNICEGGIVSSKEGRLLYMYENCLDGAKGSKDD